MRQVPSPILSYDTHPPRQWWKSRRRWAQIVVVVLIALATRYAPIGYGFVAAEYYEYLWGQYRPGPHFVLMDSSPSAANKKLDPILYDPNMPDASFAPAPPGWEHFPLDEKWPCAPLFLARRIAPNGTAYWVGLSLNFEYLPLGNEATAALRPDFRKIRILGCTASIGSLFHSSQVISGKFDLLSVDPGSRGLFRFYAGQPDPADPSRFTIDYTYDGIPGTIDGMVTDTGVVILTPRTGAVIRGMASNVWSPVPTPLNPNVP
ncbi:MAG TPA: hypothetical protein VHY37_12050 [Tepidisphaeraceae bacterium]|jgi:hypothetical protein|nr:hypothetical protein [Tepidisphaeraceae bacterium]